MPAFYDCKLCGGTHRLPTRFPSKELFELVPLHRHVCTCPQANRAAVYEDADVFWREGRGSDRPTRGEGRGGHRR